MIRTISVMFAAILVAAVIPAQAATDTPVVGVGKFEVSGKDRRYESYDSRNFQSAIETALSKSRKYTLMERGRLDALLEEQARSAGGLVTGSGSIGGFDGIDYLIYGRITQATLTSDGTGEYKSCGGKFAVDVKIVDIASGEIRLTQSIEKDNGWQSFRSNGKGQYGDPCQGVSINQLAGMANEAASEIVGQFTQTLFPVKIAKVSGDEVYLNYGEGFLEHEEYLKVTGAGEGGFIDPDTGELLGAEETLIAVVQIKALRPKYSVGEVLMLNGDLDVGMVANRLSYGDARALKKDIKKCADAAKKRDKYCAKGSKNCEKYKEEAVSACDLNNFEKGGESSGPSLGDAIEGLFGL